MAVSGTTIDQDVCTSLDIKQFGLYDIWTGVDEEYIRPVTRYIRKFSLDNYKEVELTEEEKTEGFLTAEYITDGQNCGCNNIVLETHYRVHFTGTDPADEDEIKNNQFFISKVEVDIIYGQIL